MENFNSEFDLKPNLTTPKDMLCRWNLTLEDYKIDDTFTVQRSIDEEIAISAIIDGIEAVIQPTVSRYLTTDNGIVTEQFDIDQADSVSIFYRALSDLNGSDLKLVTDIDYKNLDNDDPAVDTNPDTTNSSGSANQTDQDANSTIKAFLVIIIVGT